MARPHFLLISEDRLFFVKTTRKGGFFIVLYFVVVKVLFTFRF